MRRLRPSATGCSRPFLPSHQRLTGAPSRLSAVATALAPRRRGLADSSSGGGGSGSGGREMPAQLHGYRLETASPNPDYQPGDSQVRSTLGIPSPKFSPMVEAGKSERGPKAPPKVEREVLRMPTLSAALEAPYAQLVPSGCPSSRGAWPTPPSFSLSCSLSFALSQRSTSHFVQSTSPKRAQIVCRCRHRRGGSVQMISQRSTRTSRAGTRDRSTSF